MVLYVVPTPIGNLKDITLRALEVLQNVDSILCEDTRVTRKLLNFYSIDVKTYSYNKYNEHKKTNSIVKGIISGKSFALVSDSGTPGISDPGFYLIRECITNNIKIECLPGANALLPSIVCSGLPTNRFYFEGFLPNKKGRAIRLRELSQNKETTILFESPHRLIRCLNELSEYLEKERKIVIVRELTKRFEEIKRGTTKELLQYFSSKQIKGEFVLIIEGKGNKK